LFSKNENLRQSKCRVTLGLAGSARWKAGVERGKSEKLFGVGRGLKTKNNVRRGGFRT